VQPKPTFRERWLAARVATAKWNKPAKALELVEKLEAIRPVPVPLRFQALKGELLVRAGEPERAHDLLLQVREATKDRTDPESQYTRHFAQAWLARIRFDPFNFREQERKAAAIPCDPYLKRFLWLPSGEEIDPTDAGFDAWIKKNPPKEDDLQKRRI
jgi:hypothetical protein